MKKETESGLLLEYWMYRVIIAILKKERDNVTKNYTPEGYETFKNNKLSTIGQVELSIKKLRELQEKHDDLIKRDLG